jgi:hypothetical protein
LAGAAANIATMIKATVKGKKVVARCSDLHSKTVRPAFSGFFDQD